MLIKIFKWSFLLFVTLILCTWSYLKIGQPDEKISIPKTVMNLAYENELSRYFKDGQDWNVSKLYPTEEDRESPLEKYIDKLIKFPLDLSEKEKFSELEKLEIEKIFQQALPLVSRSLALSAEEQNYGCIWLLPPVIYGKDEYHENKTCQKNNILIKQSKTLLWKKTMFYTRTKNIEKLKISLDHLLVLIKNLTMYGRDLTEYKAALRYANYLVVLDSYLKERDVFRGTSEGFVKEKLEKTKVKLSPSLVRALKYEFLINIYGFYIEAKLFKNTSFADFIDTDTLLAEFINHTPSSQFIHQVGLPDYIFNFNQSIDELYMVNSILWKELKVFEESEVELVASPDSFETENLLKLPEFEKALVSLSPDFSTFGSFLKSFKRAFLNQYGSLIPAFFISYKNHVYKYKYERINFEKHFSQK